MSSSMNTKKGFAHFGQDGASLSNRIQSWTSMCASTVTIVFSARNCIRTPRFRVPFSAIFRGIVIGFTRMRKTSGR